MANWGSQFGVWKGDALALAQKNKHASRGPRESQGAELLNVILTKIRENLESLRARGGEGSQISNFQEYGKMGQNTGVSLWRQREALVCAPSLHLFQMKRARSFAFLQEKQIWGKVRNQALCGSEVFWETSSWKRGNSFNERPGSKCYFLLARIMWRWDLVLHALYLLGEYFKHLGCYEVNYSNNRGIQLFNIVRDCRACRKMKKAVTLKHYWLWNKMKFLIVWEWVIAQGTMFDNSKSDPGCWTCRTWRIKNDNKKKYRGCRA